MARAALVPVLMLVAAAGCVRSVNPFYVADDVVFEPAVEGAWGYGGDVTRLVKAPDGKGYLVVPAEHSDEHTPPDRLVLFRIGRHFLFDGESADDQGRFHYLYKVVANGDTLLLLPVDEGRLRELLKADPAPPKYEASEPKPVAASKRGDGKDANPFNGVTLTDSTENVRRFVAGHVDELFRGGAFPLIAARDLPLAEGEGLFGRRQRTLDYWFILRATVHPQSVEEPDKEKVLDRLREVQKQLDGLSDIGVDPDAARVRRDVRAFYAALEQFMSDDKSPPQAVGQIVQDFGAGPFSAAPSRVGGDPDLGERLRRLRADVQRHREQLVKQFGEGFPPPDL